MAEKTQFIPGTFNWVELATSDAAGAKSFYGGLFGWTAEDLPLGDGSFYSMLHLRDKKVGALYQQGQEQKSQGVPSHWLCYVSVESAEDAAAKAAALGAAILKPAFDVFDAGRMAVVQDPLGAVFALWQPRRHHGAELVNEPGCFCWNELATTDPDTAALFYKSLFNWTSETHSATIPYTQFKNGENMAAGMMRITEQMGNIPPHWLVYVAVADCEVATAQAQTLGAQVYMPPTPIPGTGTFAVLADPQGATFAVIKLLDPAA